MSARPLVLLIEDNESDVLLFERAVAGLKRPFPFRSISDGVDAIRYLSDPDRARHPLPSLVLLDLKLPRKSGLEVLEWKNGSEAARDIPFVVLTSSSEAGDIRTAFRLGVRGYVVKPVGYDRLRALVGAVSDFVENPRGGPEASFRGFLTSRPSL